MFWSNKDKQIEDKIYNLKFATKMLFRTAAGHKKKEKVYMTKAKNALKRNDERSATIYIQQSVQYTNLATSTTTLACNMEILGEKVSEAIQAGKMNEEVATAVSLLTHRIQPTQTSDSIGALDKALEDVAVCTNAIQGAISDGAAPPVSAHSDASALMDALKEEVATESSFEFMSLPTIGAAGGDTMADAMGTPKDKTKT
jgi:charged multivesicular body protein 1